MSVEKLLGLLIQIEAAIPYWKQMNFDVSEVNIGWHIEHILMATVVISGQLIQSDPGNYSWRFNKNRLLIFSINRIPRGKAKAPGQVQPNEKISPARMEKYLEIAREQISLLNGLPAGSHILHPYLGKLNLAASTRFMCIHTKHHLAIMHDILQAEHKKSIS